MFALNAVKKLMVLALLLQVVGNRLRRVAIVLRPSAMGVVNMDKAFETYMNSQQAKYDFRSIWDAAIAHQREVDANLKLAVICSHTNDTKCDTCLAMEDVIRDYKMLIRKGEIV